MIENTPLNLNDLTLLVEATRQGYFDELIKRGEKNEGLLQADHWSDEDKKDFEAQNRTPYSMPIAAHKINTVCAEQRKSRSGFQVEALSDVNDEPKAEIATMRLRDIETRNQLKFKESDTFLSGVGVIFGAMKQFMKMSEDGLNMLHFQELDYKNVFWDRNSREYERNDGVFAGEIKYMYRKDIVDEYGVDVAKNLAAGDNFLSSRGKMSYWIKPNKAGNIDLDVITVIELYYKTIRDNYVVLVRGEKVLETEDKKEADEIKGTYLVEALGDLSIEDPMVEVVQVPKPRFDKYCFTLTDLLEYEKTDLPFHPYSIYQAFSFKDKIWSLMCLLKDPQLFYDRLIAQIDYSFGIEMKNVYEVVMNQVADGLTIEEVMDRVRNNIAIPVNTKGAINPLPFQGANPQWIQTLQIFQGLAEDIGGGRSFSGLEDSPGEPGIAIQLKKMQGELITMLFVDNLHRWKRDLGTKALWHLKKYDTAPAVIKIHGGSISEELMGLLQEEQIFVPSKMKPGSGYLKINQGSPLSYIYDADLELTVTEAELSETQRQSRFAELMMFAKVYGAPPVEAWLENSPMSYTMKQKMIEYFKQQQMVQAQAAQEEANLEKAKVLISDKGQVINAATSVYNKQQQSKNPQPKKEKVKAK